MEQCGDDEDFLRELLSDLRGEIDAQILKIDSVLGVRHLIVLITHLFFPSSSSIYCRLLQNRTSDAKRNPQKTNPSYA